jgi:hypothetical protein
VKGPEGLGGGGGWGPGGGYAHPFMSYDDVKSLAR